MRYEEYRISTFCDQELYGTWKLRLQQKGCRIAGRDGELSTFNKRAFEYGIKAALKNPKIMKEIMADDTDNTTTRG